MAKKITIEELAAMTNRHFQEIEAKMATKNEVKQVITRTEELIGDVLEAIDNLGGQITDIKKNTVSVLDYVRLESRVEVLEERSEKIEARIRK